MLKNYCDPMIESFLERVPSARGFLGSLQPMTKSLGHLGKPEEIAHAVLFLCDENVEVMIGTMLSIDGGRIAM
jgi:NAD(P)-dependent dehydrogenase (short-subunit alcohol dehydrogenase family)